MGRTETTIGGSRDSFPDTPWSSVLKEENSPAREARLTQMAQLYWRPVYKYIRAKWSKRIDAAKDLTQGFFCHILESDFITRFKPQHGRFRHFLIGALKHFLSNEHARNQALKRGGGITVISIREEELETDQFAADLNRYTPEQLFDLQWARDTIAMTVNRLRELLYAEGKKEYFEVYDAYELYKEKERPTYDEVAERVGIKRDDVKNFLTVARGNFRNILLETVTWSVTSRGELMEELSQLFSE